MLIFTAATRGGGSGGCGAAGDSNCHNAITNCYDNYQPCNITVINTPATPQSCDEVYYNNDQD